MNKLYTIINDNNRNNYSEFFSMNSIKYINSTNTKDRGFVNKHYNVYRVKQNIGDNDNKQKEIYENLSLRSEKEANIFSNMLKKDFYEPGFYSSSEMYLLKKLEIEPLETKDWLNRVLINNLNKPDILVKLLHIIADVDYDLIYPQGQTLALAALAIDDSEVQECAIRAFEKWANQDSLKILKNIKLSESWLQEYVKEVIEDLEEEFS